MNTEHPFAGYIRTLGRGKRGSRSLREDEAQEAMRMILDEEVAPEQLGAFLMLLRVKEESPEEVAGFVRAARARLQLPADRPRVDLDWSSYAGKRRHLPWYLLAALLLARNGTRVFMHGSEGHTAGRLYTSEALAALGVQPSGNLEAACTALQSRGFAYLPLQAFLPRLHAIIELRPLLGLRSPVHTLARMLNPLSARASLQGIFHPGYQHIHQGAAALLHEPVMAVFKGEGGELERNPDVDCEVYHAHAGEAGSTHWPALFGGKRHMKPDTLLLTHLVDVWHGRAEDEYGEAAVIGTAAIALHLTGQAPDPDAAQALAATMWAARLPLEACVSVG